MMSFSMSYPVFQYYASCDEAALSFNSMYSVYDYQYADAPFQLFQPLPYQFPLYTPLPTACKVDSEAERSTADSEEPEEESPQTPRAEVKEEATEQRSDLLFQEDHPQQIQLPSIEKKGKKEAKPSLLKKNTEANLINNTVSYVCSEMRSHKAVHKLLKTAERRKIFYTFMNNLKKLNNKYLNRKNVMALLDLTPNQPHERVLARSVKRLQVLPIAELRVIMRRLIHDYLRTDLSLIPILTSKKICRAALKEHFEKRRELLHYFFKGRNPQ